MMDQDEFVERFLDVCDKVRDRYVFTAINDISKISAGISAEFYNLFYYLGEPRDIEIEVRTDWNDRTRINIYFLYNGVLLKEPEQIYNCLVYGKLNGWY